MADVSGAAGLLCDQALVQKRTTVTRAEAPGNALLQMLRRRSEELGAVELPDLSEVIPDKSDCINLVATFDGIDKLLVFCY